MAQVRWTLQALDDLERSASLSLATHRRLRRCLLLAPSTSQTVWPSTHALGRIVPELEIENIREVILGNDRIIYRIREEEVQVITVHHGARLLDVSKMAGRV